MCGGCLQLFRAGLMVIGLAHFCIVLSGSGQAAWAEDAWRDDFDTVQAWTARPEWLTPAADNPVAKAEAGIGRFEVSAPGQGMKWSAPLDPPIDVDLSPWLVIRYRAINFDVRKPDYVVWLKDDGRDRDGVNLLPGDGLCTDGQWHTVALSLTECGAISRVTQIALQCFANETGGGALWVDYVSITDLPPKDAEGITRAQPPLQKEHIIDLRDPETWTVQPAWLGNFTSHHLLAPISPAGSSTQEGMRFSIGEGSKGAKWSRELTAPITGVNYVAMRYRARNLRSWDDYVLYAATGGGATPLVEQYILRENQLTADGEWHVAVAPVTLSEIRRLAVQVQAVQNDALLEIADLRFVDRKPPIKLADTFESAAGWPAQLGGWRTVELPPGNLSGPNLLRLLELQGWFADTQITAAGVPFQLREGDDAVVMTPLRQPGQIQTSLSGTASEAYMLLAARFPLKDEPSYVGTSGLVQQVHRFVARISYADGTCEEQFPLAIPARQHAVSRSLHVYALALNPAKTLQELSLVDGMSRGTFGLVALTLSDQPGPATAATRLRPTPPPPPGQPVVNQSAAITHDGDKLTVFAGTIRMVMKTEPGLQVVSVANLSGAALESQVAPGPLFRVLGDGFEVSSQEFMVERVDLEQTEAGDVARIEMRCDKTVPVIRVTAWFDVTDPREIGMRASIQLNGHDPVKTSFLFPELRGLSFGGDPADSWIWCPRRGDVITAAAVSLREPYAGAGNPLQIIGAFDPGRGTGLYMMTQDPEARSKFYQVQKSSDGARLAVEYTPLHDADLPRTVIGCNQGDWHAQLARYQEWVHSWYRPAAPRKAWFREVWSFRQQFMHFALPSKSGMFDEATKTMRLKEVVDADAEAFGGVDYLHLFDWGWDPVHGRCGDYEPWDYLGGVKQFQAAVEEVKGAGIPVGLYIEGILVDPQSNLGKAHGEAWQMLGPAGQPYGYFAPSYHVCPRVPEWQAYLSDTYRRVREQTGAVGFYIDQFGFSGPTYWCYNPQHNHPVPVTPVLGEREMLKQVRQALGPDAAIYTEESPTDVNSQYQDGSFTYNISSVPDEWSPSHVNLYRFAFPSFKTIEIICCDQPLGTNVEAVKRCLFNGEAIWIEGIRDQWFAPEVRAQIALNRRVMRENRECFAGDDVRPLVPTLLSGLYANRFGADAVAVTGKTCWTIYNTNYRTVAAEVLAVTHRDGAQYRDEMTGKSLTPRIADGLAHLALEIGPRDVVVISSTVAALAQTAGGGTRAWLRRRP